MSDVQVVANRGDIGGGEVMLLRLATVLRELGHRVLVVAPAEPGELAAEAGAAGFEVVALPGAGRAAYARAVRRWARGRPGLLWCNGLVPALATVGRPRRVVHLHQLPTGLQRPAAWLATRRCELVVVPSRFMADRLGRGVRVLPNWTEPLTPRRRTSAHHDATVRIGFLGRVGRAKGVDVLLRACSLLDPDTRSRIDLVIAGDARFMPEGDEKAIEAARDAAGVRVHFPGWISRDDFFADVDLAVFPSVWDEPFGLVVAEAMAAACPLVVTDAGALPEVVGDGYPWMARRGDEHSLAEVVARAVDELPAAEITALMRARWAGHFSPDAAREQVETLADTLVQRGVLERPAGRGGRP